MGYISSDIDSFLGFLETEKAASSLTIKNYRNYLNHFSDFLAFEDSKNYPRIKDSSEIDVYLVNRYRYFLAKYRHPETKQPFKKSTQNYFLIALRQFLKFLEDNELPSLSSGQVKLTKQKRNEPQIINPEDFAKLFKAPDPTTIEGLRDQAILMLVYSTGLLSSEVSKLNRDDVTSGQKLQSLSAASLQPLRRYLEARTDLFKPLFIRYKGEVKSEDDGERMRLTSRSIERMVEKYSKMAHLKIKVTPLVLRHSFAVQTLLNGSSLETLQLLLGHTSLSSTLIYEKLIMKVQG